jgi:hypothetical protein
MKPGGDDASTESWLASQFCMVADDGAGDRPPTERARRVT